MSLISEALKRARAEAAQREAAEKGLPDRPSPARLPRRRRSAVVPTVVVVVLLGVSVGAAFWLGRRSVEPPPASGRGSAVTAPVPSTAGGEPGRASGGEPRPAANLPPSAAERPAAPVASTPGPGGAPADHPSAPASGTAAEAPRASSGDTVPRDLGSIANRVPRAPAAAPAPVPARPSSTVPAGSAAAPSHRSAPAAATPASAAPVAEPSDGESFVRRLPLPGGKVIELGGIAWSESEPIAVINGELTGRGQIVDGYTVDAIEPGRVWLRKGETTVFLKLR